MKFLMSSPMAENPVVQRMVGMYEPVAEWNGQPFYKQATDAGLDHETLVMFYQIDELVVGEETLLGSRWVISDSSDMLLVHAHAMCEDGAGPPFAPWLGGCDEVLFAVMQPQEEDAAALGPRPPSTPPSDAILWSWAEQHAFYEQQQEEQRSFNKQQKQEEAAFKLQQVQERDLAAVAGGQQKRRRVEPARSKAPPFKGPPPIRGSVGQAVKVQREVQHEMPPPPPPPAHRAQSYGHAEEVPPLPDTSSYDFPVVISIWLKFIIFRICFQNFKVNKQLLDRVLWVCHRSRTRSILRESPETL